MRDRSAIISKIVGDAMGTWPDLPFLTVCKFLANSQTIAFITGRECYFIARLFICLITTAYLGFNQCWQSVSPLLFFLPSFDDLLCYGLVREFVS